MSNRIDDDIVRRARARAILQQPRDPRKRPSYVVFQFVGCVGAPEERKSPNYEFDRAEIFEHIPGEPVKRFVRGEDESVRDFEKRVLDALPITGVPTASFHSPDIPEALNVVVIDTGSPDEPVSEGA